MSRSLPGVLKWLPLLSRCLFSGIFIIDVFSLRVYLPYCQVFILIVSELLFLFHTFVH